MLQHKQQHVVLNKTQLAAELRDYRFTSIGIDQLLAGKEVAFYSDRLRLTQLARTETVDKNETITVAANRTETVDLNESIKAWNQRGLSPAGVVQLLHSYPVVNPADRKIVADWIMDD